MSLKIIKRIIYINKQQEIFELDTVWVSKLESSIIWAHYHETKCANNKYTFTCIVYNNNISIL